MLGRHDGRDNISIVACDTWEAVKTFQLVENSDCGDIAWSPDDRCIAAWDGSLEYKLAMYLPNGSLLSKYSAYEHQLGIKAVQWAPSGQFIAYYEVIDACNQSSYVLGEAPHAITTERLDPTDQNPKLGVSVNIWSPDSRYLATRCDAMPRTLWIWETVRLSLCSIILQDGPILVRCGTQHRHGLRFVQGITRCTSGLPTGARASMFPHKTFVCAR